MNVRIAVRAIIVKDGKLLCVKLNDAKTHLPVDFWCVFGGGVDEGESLHNALIREMKEETGIAPQIGNLLFVQEFVNVALNNQQCLEFFFHVTNTDNYLDIDLSKTSHGQAEIAEIAFLDPPKHRILPEFLQHETYEDMSSRPTKYYNYI